MHTPFVNRSGTLTEHLLIDPMTRRTRSKVKTIEAVFPIRVHISYKRETLPGALEAIERWGTEHLGRGRLATHTSAAVGMHQATLYFRSFAEAERCFETFAELQLRDWVAQTSLESAGWNYGVFDDLQNE